MPRDITQTCSRNNKKYLPKLRNNDKITNRNNRVETQSGHRFAIGKQAEAVNKNKLKKIKLLLQDQHKCSPFRANKELAKQRFGTQRPQSR